MNNKALALLAATSFFLIFKMAASNITMLKQGGFNIEKDLLLVQFDCKTDVDDLHTIAAFATLMSTPQYSTIHYHAVAGTYGVQEGLYVPPNELFQLAFGQNWSDADANRKKAIEKVLMIATETLSGQGDIWIAEAGQSDFSAGLIEKIQLEFPAMNLSERIHVVQHSDWNEEVTDQNKLDFVKNTITYHKIPDGNAVGNGSPGFRSPKNIDWKSQYSNIQLIEIWELALDISNKYNGKEGRYLNEAIAAGGLDFSDLSEVCWILGIQDIKDADQFFKEYAN